jgi:hypothetical protein
MKQFLILLLSSSLWASDLPSITLENLKLTGDLSGERAAFTLTAQAKVESAGEIDILSGPVALTEIAAHPGWRLRVDQGKYRLVFDKTGRFPIQLQFNTVVMPSEFGKAIRFAVAPGLLQPIVLRGLRADTQFEFAEAARPQRKGEEFVSYLPADGVVRLAWKEAKPETEGKLFYAAEMRSQICVSPGLMRQVALVECRVMQGELSRLVLSLHGPGEVTRVQGEQVLAWTVENATNTGDRQLIVQFNQPQKEQFSIHVQAQAPLGAFPQTAEALELRPEGATRFAGYVRIVNEGAVRLEVAQASGVSQISPEQFPETETTRAALRPTGTQRFVYRFSGPGFGLRIQADQIQPELGVSQVVTYRLGESELAIDAELELDVREAPLRELVLRVPKGYALARLNASGMNDYFTHELEDQPESELRLVYGQPVTGRQLIQLGLERNQSLGGSTWELPAVSVPKAKSVRGQIGVASEAGFRLTPDRTQALTEIATAFFPRKVAGLQVAFRMSEPGWGASLHVERLPQTVQADVFHLFSIGEGIAYGSSLINYQVSGAPVSALKIELSEEYFNVEFTGKDLRNWQKAPGGYLVQLHTPVSGAYTLLATYERPFKAQGETLAFTGARSLDAQSEQGHTLVISANQFQVKPTDVSPGLLALETGEVPAEYRLFFDAPILAAYRYSSRPFSLKLALSPLAQADSLSQVADRACLTTHISKEGAVLTDARYFIKSRGNPHFRLTLPPDTQLWSASVNGAPAVPVTDAQANLIPLPQGGDPNAVNTIDLKLAAKSKDARRVRIEAPRSAAPVLLAEWKLQPDAGRRLVYESGSLAPQTALADTSGFGQLTRLLSAPGHDNATVEFLAVIVFVGAALVLWRWAAGRDSFRFSSRHLFGSICGLLAVVLAAVFLVRIGNQASSLASTPATEVALLAPVQPAGSTLAVEVSNLPDQPLGWGLLWLAGPALLALPAWLMSWGKAPGRARQLYQAGGWMLLAWGCLRLPNGAPYFLGAIALFLMIEVLLPTALGLLKVARRPEPAAEPPGAASAGAATVASALVLAWLTLSGLAAQAAAPVIESAAHELRAEEKYVAGSLKLVWLAEKGQELTLPSDPAVLTQISFPSNVLKLVSLPGTKPAQQLVAQKTGRCEVEVRYETPVVRRDSETGVTLPSISAWINRLTVTVVNQDVEVSSPRAVTVQRQAVGSNTIATIALSTGGESWVSWKPRSRDVKREKAVFYADLTQLYAPAAGVIEGIHTAAIRPAQGELGEVVFEVPPGATITDVLDGAKPGKESDRSLVSLWRFDPDTRKLRVTLSPAQSRPFTLRIRSQAAAGPLPFEATVGLLGVEGAAAQLGLVGLATGAEVQLDSVTAEAFSPINLEDFPGDTLSGLGGGASGLIVRRAYRYGSPRASASIKVSAVEPDVRVESQDTLSLGEDRSVLAADATVEISRAGIFRLSFLMPAGYDVESISGTALSHWTEARNAAGRLITLHLAGKTEGRQQFALSLAGPGVKDARGWSAPQVVWREANKQRGALLVAPEQGMRLQVAAREGATQLDPQKSGIRQKGVLAFRVLQAPWKLALDIERVEPWIQVTSLQQAAINEALVKVEANLQYQIENTGLKSLRVLLPAAAENVRFQGDQLADFMALTNPAPEGFKAWEIKLHRRVIGAYLLRVGYQTLLPDQAGEAVLRGIQAADINMQRGFVTVQSSGRLQLRAEATPEALQPSEWQSIPRALRQDLPAAAASLTYRLVEPSFQLPLKLQRHEAARLLAARVNRISLDSVISDSGGMLTRARLELLPGDKRLLSVTLPQGARFWFAFVGSAGVWPWREEDRILIPLEQSSRANQPVPVELYYSAEAGAAGSRSLELLAPKFDLPLENITWQVSMNEKWRLRRWAGSLQLLEQRLVPQSAALDLNAYLQDEATLQGRRVKEAETLLADGNSALENGDPQQARRSFQAACGMATRDAAFNEDARVQLHNIKLQQALVGLNVRQVANAPAVAAGADKLRDLRTRRELAYTQQDAKDIIDRNTADDNAAFMRLAERLIQQQDAAASTVAPIRASVPEQGHVLTFKRAVAVDQWADLKIDLKISTPANADWPSHAAILATLAAAALAILWSRKLWLAPES